MFWKKKEGMSRSERNDKRDNISVGLQAASLLTSVATLGLTAGAMFLNRKPKEEDDGQPVYYMSESMGMIRWE